MAPQSSVATKQNPTLVAAIHDLKRRASTQDAPIWRAVAERLAKPTRQQVVVNLGDVERYVKPGGSCVVPGKLLAAGHITKPVTVGAFQFSAAAKAKVEKAGGTCLTLGQLAEKNPSGTNVRILG